MSDPIGSEASTGEAGWGTSGARVHLGLEARTTLAKRNFYVTVATVIARRTQKTGVDKFIDEQMKSPSFAKSYAEARSEVDAIDAMVRALDAAREKSGLTKAGLAAAIEARPEVVRRLFTQKNPNPTLSTLIRLAAVLGYRIELVHDTRRGRTHGRVHAAA